MNCLIGIASKNSFPKKITGPLLILSIIGIAYSYPQRCFHPNYTFPPIEEQPKLIKSEMPHVYTDVSLLDKNPSSAVWLDSDNVLFSANLNENSDFEPNNSDIHKLNIKTGDLKKLTTRLGPDRSPAVSPDGTKIAYLGYDDKYLGYQQSSLYIMDTDGGNIKLISEGFDRNISNINWILLEYFS